MKRRQRANLDGIFIYKRTMTTTTLLNVIQFELLSNVECSGSFEKEMLKANSSTEKRLYDNMIFNGKNESLNNIEHYSIQ